MLPTMALSLVGVYGLAKLGLTSSTREINVLNRRLFNEYKDDVVRPELRGLKLHRGKKAYQIDNKEFTTSNFDDLKDLVMG